MLPLSPAHVVMPGPAEGRERGIHATVETREAVDGRDERTAVQFRFRHNGKMSMSPLSPAHVVMPGPAGGRDPGIHAAFETREAVDGRDEHGHDEFAESFHGTFTTHFTQPRSCATSAGITNHRL